MMILRRSFKVSTRKDTSSSGRLPNRVDVAEWLVAGKKRIKKKKKKHGARETSCTVQYVKPAKINFGKKQENVRGRPPLALLRDVASGFQNLTRLTVSGPHGTVAKNWFEREKRKKVVWVNRSMFPVVLLY